MPLPRRLDRPPNAGARNKRDAAIANFRVRQHVAARPNAGRQGRAVFRREAVTQHRFGRAGVVVGQGAMLYSEIPTNGGDQAEPAARRAIVSGHSHHTGVVPQAATHGLRKRQPEVSGDDSIAACQFQIALLDEARRGREYELIDLPNASMDDRQTASVELEINPPRQLRKPTARVGADLGAGIRKPARRQLLTGAARRETATAVIGAERKLLIALAHDDSYAGGAEGGGGGEIEGGRGMAAVGGEVASADRWLTCDAEPFGLRKDRSRRREIAIRPAENENGPVNTNERSCVQPFTPGW